MADITTFDGLSSTIADWLNRDDLTAQIPVFIQLAEVAMAKDERFRTQHLLVRAQAPITSQFTPLPDDFLEMSNLRLLVQSQAARGTPTIEYVTPSDMDELRLKYPAAEQPRFYTIVGEEIEVLPVPGASYIAEMVYHGKAPALSPTNQSNWLSKNHPDLYLYGALLQAAPYLKNDERLGTWGTFYSTGADALKVSTQRAAYGAAPLKMRARSFG
jgi:hypothetical protein